MSEQPRDADDTMKFGLLMESAQAHQKLAEAHLEKLRAHTQDIDGVVRDEIRRTLVEELRALTVESERAARTLRDIKRTAGMHTLVWQLGLAAICTAVPAAAARWLLPSPNTIGALRQQQEALTRNVAQLEQQGGKAQWQHCGGDARLCVRVDRQAPVYGLNADYYVVKGY